MSCKMAPIVATLLMTIQLLAGGCRALDIRWSCRQPMGMQSGRIPDSALSASSSFDVPSVGPQHARLGVDRSGGAWCPKRAVARDVVEYLQIDLNAPVIVSGIATQGRYGNGRGQEYTEAYRLEYWRPQTEAWIPYKSRHLGTDSAGRIFDGNSDTWTPVRHNLQPPLVGVTKLRVVPFGIHPRTVCMRVELYGCFWNESVAFYSMPAGHEWSDGLVLDDVTYDGVRDDHRWVRGLGMLTDTQFGSDQFLIDHRKSYGWIGWKNDSLNNQPVEIVFKFDGLQNFSAVHLHAANFFTQNVQVFSKVRLRFSLDGRQYSALRSVTYVYMADSALENARNVTVHVPNVSARYVKMQLHFAARWMLISEITFDSVKIDDAPVADKPTAAERSEAVDVADDVVAENDFAEDLVIDQSTSSMAGNSLREHSDVFNTESAGEGLFEAIVGALSAVMLLLIVVMVAIIWTNHRRKGLQEALAGKFDSPYQVAGSSHASTATSATTAALQISPPGAKIDRSMTTNESVDDDDDLDDNDADDTDGCLQLPASESAGRTNRQRLARIADEPHHSPDPGYASLTRIRPNPLVVQSSGNIHQIGKCSLTFGSLRIGNGPPPLHLGANGKQFPRIGTDPLSRRVIQIRSTVPWHWNIRPLCGDVWQRDRSPKTSAKDQPEVTEIPRHHLRLVEWLGSSTVGEAYVCHATGDEDNPYENTTNGIFTSGQQRLKDKALLVRGGRFSDIQAFRTEVRMLSTIRHERICSLLAFSLSQADGNNGWMIFECPVYGDLNGYLKQLPSDLDTTTVLGLAIQITTACQYLENRGLVHKDLATRNCFLGPELHVKIGDLAVVCANFRDDYGEVRGRKMLPIRWLPWENLVLGKFGEHSCVWMLAVTVWEMSTAAKERPYCNLSDAQVILNADHFYYSDGKEVILPAPRGRPADLYLWMKSCWVRQEDQRPSFTETLAYLNRLMTQCYSLS